VLALQVTLIPSSQMAYTYPYARGHLLYRRSRVELLKPDYEVRGCLPDLMFSAAVGTAAAHTPSDLRTTSIARQLCRKWTEGRQLC
jgi:hypothetical protein